jgi:hypothetical protein
MPAPAVKTPGSTIRVRRIDGETPVMEYGWTLQRFEPDSGNVIAEKDGMRITCAREDFELLNFPGSDDIWEIISCENPNDDLKKAGESWKKLDLPGVLGALLRHARGMDPSFSGVQTVSDLRQKIDDARRTFSHQMDVLRLEARRAEEEYNRCPARTAFDNDQKDTLLSRWRGLEDRYSSRKYCCEKLLPIWQKMASALEHIDAIIAKTRQTSP